MFLPTVERPKGLSVPSQTRPPGAIIRAMAPPVVDNEGTATLRIYEEIDSWGWWGLSAEVFAGHLDALPRNTQQIVVRLNSPGGDVFDGITIANSLRAHPAPVRVHVDGLAASIASVIALAGDELVMGPQSEFMIHDAWGVARGNADDMRALGDLLDHLSDNIAGAYASRAGGTTEEWRARMKSETWFSASETVEAGLADTLEDPSPGKVTGAPGAAAAAKFDLASFRYAGRAGAPPPALEHNPGAGVARAQAALIRAKRRTRA